MRSTCSCTTCIVYVNLFKDRSFHDCCSFQKADAKVRTLKHIFQIIFGSFFLSFLFFLFPRRLSCRKGGKKEKGRKTRSPFLERRMSTRAAFVFKSGCKGKNFKAYLPNVPEVFFIFLFQDRSSERNLWQRREKWKLTAPFYCQNVKTSPPSFPKADAKVGLLRTSAKYIQAFF